MDPFVPSSPQANDLLTRERSNAKFNTKELSEFILGAEYLELLEELAPLIENEPAFSKETRYFESRKERVTHAMGKEFRLLQLLRDKEWDRIQFVTADYLIDESGPLSLHRSMFITTLESQGTPEQHEEFLEPAKKYQIIGCYAQTEIGHGSNVQGLETTATFIKETDEFELHTPFLSALKWWIGGLGIAATHAVVMARLIINQKDHGVHPFVVPVRSLKDHKPLPGITVGDIGPKFGFNTVDNGFIAFNRYRIPRRNMLSKYSKVTREGEYIKPPNAKLSYGTMVFIRSLIVRSMGLSLARSSTIVTRYSAIRRQFVSEDSTEVSQETGRKVETTVINYPMQQYRIFPLIAQTFAMIFTGRKMVDEYFEMQSKILEGDFSSMADVHATSSGLKSLTTMMAIDGTEIARRACGGLGYSSFSGLESFYRDLVPSATWEGDNYILTQQLGRYLMKTLQSVKKGQLNKNPSDSEVYLNDYLKNKSNLWDIKDKNDLYNSPKDIVKAFSTRAAFIANNTLSKLQSGANAKALQIDYMKLSKAHCQYILVRNFAEKIEDTPNSCKEVILDLFYLFSIHLLDTELSEFLESGCISMNSSKIIHDSVADLLTKIRPNAVAIVDSLNVSDYLMNSAIGSKDGQVYEKMVEMAQKELFNNDDEWQESVAKWIKQIRSVFKSKL